jgi:alkylhydroperoxidase/carboxymuconolactone decarboxylase family protein YurZ
MEGWSSALKYKHLIALALSICQGVEEGQARKVLARALEAGATKDEMIETILVTALVASKSIPEKLLG